MMTIGQAKQTQALQSWNLLTTVPLKKIRIHDFTNAVCGSEYVFETIDAQGNNGYMTAQCRGVKLGDTIVIQPGVSPERYRVEQIEYYSSPADMWIALLVKIG
jgi:MioC protein